MASIRSLFGKSNHALTRLKIRLEKRLGILDDIVVVPFTSWGTPDVLHVQGRVMEKTTFHEPWRGDSVLTAVANTLSRLESDEIPEAVLVAQTVGEPITVVADTEGFFRFDVTAGAPFQPGWHHVLLELIESIAGNDAEPARAGILVPHPESQYVVVSDVDDTVVVTGATDTLRMMRIVGTKHAHERSLFPGVGALYRAFRNGRSGYPDNAIFYVTRSGWNLHDLFIQIFDENHLPKGPLLMQDFSRIEPPSESFRSQQTKSDWLDLLFSELPHPFVLIGDSGQHDPETYLECAKRWPGRIAAVLIRDVTSEGRDRTVLDLAAEIRTLGVQVAVSDSSVELARQAVHFGLIDGRSVAAVERETERDDSKQH